MLSRDAHLKKIASILAHLESYLRLLSAQNLNDGAVLFEDACIPLLNTVFGLSLKNANDEHANFPAADLIALDARRGFQITINATKEKIRDTHRKATAHGLATQIERLTIFFVVRDAPAEPEENSTFSRCSAPKIDTLDLTGLVTKIRGFETDRIAQIAAILERDISPAIPKIADKPNNLPAAIGHLFIGRGEFLSDLGKAIARGGSAVITQPVAVQGMGGVGKTRTAIEYAWQHSAAYDALLFITADSPENLLRDLAALCGANVLNLPERDATDLPAQAAAAVAWLRAHPGWLLLIDNVDTPEAQRAVTALAAKIPHGHLIITTRIAAWPTHFTALDLRVLDEKASVEFLTTHTEGRRTIAPDDHDRAQEIARDLDGLCLALEQAAAWIRKGRRTFAKYLTEWRSQSTRIHHDYQDRGLGDYHAAHPEIPRALFITYETSLRELTEPARHLFRILAWFAPDPIPVALFEKLTIIPEAAEVLIELADISLATLTADGTTASIHRMLQRIGREQQGEEKPAALFVALQWIADEFQFSPDGPLDWPIVKPLIPHVIAVANSGAKNGFIPLGAVLLSRAGIALKLFCDFSAAEVVIRRALNLAETELGPEHVITSGYCENLAVLLLETDQYSEAEQLFRTALSISVTAFGKLSPEVASRQSNLAMLLLETNRLPEAEQLMRQALEIDEAAYGGNSPIVAVRLNNLAQVLHNANRLDEAEGLMRRALVIDEKEFGSTHARMANRKGNLAELLREKGDLAGAESLMRQVLRVVEVHYGDAHPMYGRALNNLANLLQKTNRLQEAEGLFRASLEIDIAHYGPEHPHLAGKLGNLGLLLSNIGNVREAEPMLRRALTFNEQSLDENHPDIARNLNNLATLLVETGRATEAEPMFRRQMQILMKFTADNKSEHKNLIPACENYLAVLIELGRTKAVALANIAEMAERYDLPL